VYPSCSQVQVTGSGTKAPTSSYLVSFPGAYTASTPGIVYDAYKSQIYVSSSHSYSSSHRDLDTSAYPIPGPAVWTG
jgi:hypothetical protein